MKVDILIAEIGSTTTMVNAFSGLESDLPSYLGQGVAPTSVQEGDVRIGLDGAVKDLRANLGVDELTWVHFFATSSAAGGLRMTVHGLAYDMTVRAGREAALGAGANLHHVTAGKLRRSDLKKISSIHPNIILIAGGVDYGERDTALHNSELIAGMMKEEGLSIPVIYAGNIVN
ncbi:MAG: glutamate mutase L, partial [Sediminispirochaetaceae bacterium]